MWSFHTAWTFTRAWPFKYINGEQTPESVLLENPPEYIPNIPLIEDALV